MLDQFGVFTSFQIVMAIILVYFGMQYRKEQHTGFLHLLIVPTLFLFWNSVLIYYFSSLLSLTLLWDIIGLGSGLFLGTTLYGNVDGFLFYPCSRCLKCPKSYSIMLLIFFNIIAIFSLQGVVLKFPLLIHYWLFNEVLGFCSGLSSGVFWGAAAMMIYRVRMADSDTNMPFEDI